MRAALLVISVILFFIAGVNWWAASLGHAVEVKQEPEVVEEKFKVDLSVHESEVSDKIETYFSDLFKHTRFSGAVLVSHRGDVVYKDVKGWSSYLEKDTLRFDNVFQLASVSKQFTALAIVLLKQQGKLNYKDSVFQYLKGFPYKNITIHHLLTHQTGLQNYMYFAETLDRSKKQLTNQEVFEIIQKHKNALKPYWSPGRKFYYSNTGYALLASIVEKVSGQSFASFLHENFFYPANMQQTFVGRDSIADSLSTRGHYFSRRQAPFYYQDAVVGDKSIYSCAEDMYRWDRFLKSGNSIELLELDTAFHFHSRVRRNVKGYGYGWRLWHYPDGRKIEYHTGWYRGYTALFVRIRETDSTIIILSNIVNRSFMRSFHNLVDILYS